MKCEFDTFGAFPHSFTFGKDLTAAFTGNSHAEEDGKNWKAADVPW